MKQTLKALFLATFVSVSLSGCIYKIDVQQGNIITDKDVQRIQTGMSSTAVVQMLGEPLLRNVFKDNRLAYVYTMKQGRQPMHRRNLTIYFKDDKVTHYTTSSAVDYHNKK